MKKSELRKMIQEELALIKEASPIERAIAKHPPKWPVEAVISFSELIGIAKGVYNTSLFFMKSGSGSDHDLVDYIRKIVKKKYSHPKFPRIDGYRGALITDDKFLKRVPNLKKKSKGSGLLSVVKLRNEKDLMTYLKKLGL